MHQNLDYLKIFGATFGIGGALPPLPTLATRLVADVANHAKFVFSWSAWVVYGFAIATKGSKPHSHQQLLPWRVARWVQMAPSFHQFWTANIQVLSKNCYDHVKPIIQSTKVKIASIFAKFLRWSYRGTKCGGDLHKIQKFRKNFPICLGKFLKQNHCPANSPTRLLQSGAKFGRIENPPPP